MGNTPVFFRLLCVINMYISTNIHIADIYHVGLCGFLMKLYACIDLYVYSMLCRVSNKKALEVYKKYGYVHNMFSAYGYSIECILFRIMWYIEMSYMVYVSIVSRVKVYAYVDCRVFSYICISQRRYTV